MTVLNRSPMVRKATNKLLQKAKKSKSDEFYTQLCDIQNELCFYKTHFKNKVVYCNCDDPRTSNFFQYFSSNFEELGLEKLLTSCYQEQSEDLFIENNQARGFFSEHTRLNRVNRKINSPEILLFNGDGDFRSSESIELLMQADIVVTNPPFSLFREYVEQLVKHQKKVFSNWKC